MSALDLAGRSVGRFNRGPKDLSTNEKHLDDILHGAQPVGRSVDRRTAADRDELLYRNGHRLNATLPGDSPMNRAEVLERLSRHLPEIRRRFGVRTLALFGSLARGEARLGSDIDVLADFPAPPSFDQYVGLKLFLEDLLHSEVDLVTRGGLREQIRPKVEREAVSVP